MQLVVVRDADDARLLRADEDVERHARGLEPVDHADPVGVARGVATVCIRGEHPTGRQVLDALDRVAGQVGQFDRRQALG